MGGSLKSLRNRILIMLCIASVSADLASSQTREPPEKQTQPAEIVTVIVSPKEAKEIRQLLDLLPETPGGPQQTSQVIDQIIGAYRKAMPNVPNQLWQEITPQLKTDFGPDKMAELILADEVYQIVGAALEVYWQLGRGFL